MARLLATSFVPPHDSSVGSLFYIKASDSIFGNFKDYGCTKTISYPKEMRLFQATSSYFDQNVRIVQLLV